MAFSLSGNVITQTGTDADLSGLSGLAGVTVSGNVYTIAADKRLVVEGTLTLIPEDNVLQFLAPSGRSSYPRMRINGDANFTFGRKTVSGNTVTYSRGTGLIFQGSGGLVYDTRTNGAFSTSNGSPTITMYGGTIISGKPISLMGDQTFNGVGSYRGGGTLTIEQTTFRMTSTNQLRVDCNSSSNFNVSNARLFGANNNAFLVSESYTSFSAIFDHFLLQSYASQPRGLVFNDLQFANNQAIADVQFNTGGEVIAIINSDSGASTRRRFINNGGCHFAFYGQPLIKVLDTASNPINTAKYYVRDTDDGNRFAPIGNTSDLTGLLTAYGASSETEYTGFVDVNGEASPTILLATTRQRNGISDYSNGGGLSDRFDIFIADYNSNLSSQSVVLRTPGGTPANFFLLTDESIAEATKATVDAYTDLETAQKFYDRAKAYLVDNYAGETSTLVSRSGDTIDAGSYDVVVDATAAVPFAFDGSVITIKTSDFAGNISTTGIVTLQNGASVSGGIEDASGVQKSITGLPAGADACVGAWPVSQGETDRTGIITATVADAAQTSLSLPLTPGVEYYIVADARGYVRTRPARLSANQLSLDVSLDRITDQSGAAIIPATLGAGQQRIADMIDFEAATSIARHRLPDDYVSDSRWNAAHGIWTFRVEDFYALAHKIEALQSSAPFLALPNTITIRPGEFELAPSATFKLGQHPENQTRASGAILNFKALSFHRAGSGTDTTFLDQTNGPIEISTGTPFFASIDTDAFANQVDTLLSPTLQSTHDHALAANTQTKNAS